MSPERRRLGRWRWRLAGLALLVCLVGSIPGYRHLTEHVQRISGNASASLNCVPCHVLSKQDGPLARLMHRQYLSPLDIAVAEDGRNLYVTAEDSDVLLVVDVMEKRVASAIPVGSRPHSVLLSRDATTSAVPRDSLSRTSTPPTASPRRSVRPSDPGPRS